MKKPSLRNSPQGHTQSWLRTRLLCLSVPGSNFTNVFQHWVITPWDTFIPHSKRPTLSINPLIPPSCIHPFYYSVCQSFNKHLLSIYHIQTFLQILEIQLETIKVSSPNGAYIIEKKILTKSEICITSDADEVLWRKIKQGRRIASARVGTGAKMINGWSGKALRMRWHLSRTFASI